MATVKEYAKALERYKKKFQKIPGIKCVTRFTREKLSLNSKALYNFFFSFC